METALQTQVRLTPQAVLTSAQRAMMQAAEGNPEYSSNEPFPIEISELFLYSPDGVSAALVFQFLGNECVLVDEGVAVDQGDNVKMLDEPYQYRALEFLVFRIRTLNALGA